MRRFPNARQPAGPAPLLSEFARLRASYITQGSAYSTDTGPQSLRGFFDPGAGPLGSVAVPNTNSRTVSMGLPFSETVYEFLCLFEVRTAAITSATGAARFLTAAQDGSTTANAIIAGSATGLLTGETLTVLDSGSGRTGITDSLAVGPHSLLVYWDGAQYQFVLDGIPRTASNGGSGASALIASGGHVGGRTLSGAAWICPALSVINPTPDATLRRVAGNPWQIFAPQTARIYSFPSAGGGVTGTGSPTEADDVSSGAGNVTTTGAGSPTNAADTSSGAGNVTTVGAGSPTEDVDVSAGSGTVGSESGVTGSGSPTEADDVSAGAGKKTHVGSGAVTEGDDVSSGVGTRGHVGTGTVTESGDVSTGSGVVGTGEETTRPLGLSPWRDFGKTENRDDQAARIRAQRERMGILEVVERFDEAANRAIEPQPRKRDPIEVQSRNRVPNAPESRSENGTRTVLSLQAAREAQEDRARLLAVLEAMEARKQIEIRRRMALLLLAAEA